MKHLFIGWLVVKGNDRYAVVDLVGEGVDRVVHDDHVFHRSIPYNAQVFDIVALWRLHTMLPVQPVLEKLVLRVYVVKDSIGISLVACSENDHLEFFVRFLQALHQVRPQIYACTNCFLSWEINFKNDVWVLRLDVVHTVN